MRHYADYGDITRYRRSACLYAAGGAQVRRTRCFTPRLRRRFGLLRRPPCHFMLAPLKSDGFPALMLPLPLPLSRVRRRIYARSAAACA